MTYHSMKSLRDGHRQSLRPNATIVHILLPNLNRATLANWVLQTWYRRSTGMSPRGSITTFSRNPPRYWKNKRSNTEIWCPIIRCAAGTLAYSTTIPPWKIPVTTGASSQRFIFSAMLTTMCFATWPTTTKRMASLSTCTTRRSQFRPYGRKHSDSWRRTLNMRARIMPGSGWRTARGGQTTTSRLTAIRLVISGATLRSLIWTSGGAKYTKIISSI